MTSSHLHVGRQPTEDVKLPVFYAPTPLKLAQELLHDYSAVGMIDGTPSNGSMAMAALLNSTTYVGLCFNSEHVEALYHKFDNMVFKEFQKSDSKFYQPDLVRELTGGKKVNLLFLFVINPCV